MTTKGKYSEKPEVFIIEANNNNSSITVDNIWCNNKDGKLVSLLNQGFDLPKTLKSKESISLPSPYLAHNIEKVTELYAEDAQGRKWEVNKKSFLKAKEIMKNYVGVAGLFYSKDDNSDDKST